MTIVPRKTITPAIAFASHVARRQSDHATTGTISPHLCSTFDSQVSVGATRVASTQAVISTEKEASSKTQHDKKADGDVPGGFGGSNGPTISNKDTIFDEIDKALGVSRPPDVEVILTDHLAYVGNPISKFVHKNLIRFGHVAIRYTTSDGVQRVMNILGDFDDPDSSLVNFLDPKDYFYGTHGFKSYAQQGGVYNRPYVGLRIEKVSPGATDALHAYYEALSKAAEIGQGSQLGDRPGSPNRGAVRFQLVEVQLSKLARTVPAPFDKILFSMADFFRNQHKRAQKTKKHSSKGRSDGVNHARNDHGGGSRFAVPSAEAMKEEMEAMKEEMEVGMEDVREALYNSGNCAQWTSGGLSFVGMVRRPRLFPKAILVELLEEEILQYNRPNNVNLVYYREVEHAQKNDPNYKFIKSAMVSPLKPIRTAFYDDMEKFASAVVNVPKGTTKAVVENVRNKRVMPGVWLQLLSFGTTYVPAAVLIGLVDNIGPLGPAAAGAWLAANWWLY